MSYHNTKANWFTDDSDQHRPGTYSFSSYLSFSSNLVGTLASHGDKNSGGGGDALGGGEFDDTPIEAGNVLPTDPLLAQQWHLNNPNLALLDLNVFGVWNPTEGAAYTGAGTRTIVIDDGVDFTHSDLSPNYDTSLDFDFQSNTLSAFGFANQPHGTAVAGIIGADNNGTGAVGVAFDTSLVGYRTANLISDAWLQDIRDAIHHSAVSALADVANISQGIANDLSSEFGVGYAAVRFDEIETSIGTAVNQGRGGLGMTIVKSAGNSRAGNYDVNADDWTNDTRQVVVAAVDQNGFVSSYSSYGSANLVSGFGTPGQVLTTDRVGAAGYNNTDFTSTFNGTSSAAPMVAGVVALMYDANSALGWRDVQSILANSAVHVGSAVGGGIAGSERYAWQFNGAETWNGGGLHFSNDYGYGLVDALAAVRLAETWLLGGPLAQRTNNEFTNFRDVLNVATVIPDGNATGLSFSGNLAFDDIVDRMTVQMTFSTTFTGDVEVYLTSPEGTVSRLIDNAGGSNDFNGTWTFESQAFRGERAAGIWTVRVADTIGGDTLTVSDIIIRSFGAFTTGDRYVFTNEYSDYDGVFGHDTNITDTNGGTDVVNAAAVTSNSVIRLDGVFGSIDGVAVRFTNIENAIGGDGSDTLIGNSGNNLLYGQRGNDILWGNAGNDTLHGGTGIDTANYSNAPSGVNVNLGFGAAQNTGGGGIDAPISIENVVGSNFADTLAGTNGVNVLTGLGGNDTLVGRGGNDTLDGGPGTDTVHYAGSPGGVTVNLATGTATGAWGNDTIIAAENVIGSAFNDVLTGNSGANLLAGLGGNDALNGAGGNDNLSGAHGNDVLIGGPGKDGLLGGNNADIFRFNSITETLPGAPRDVIIDFSRAQGDKIDVSGIDARLDLAGNQAFTFIGTAAFTGVDGQLRQGGNVIQGDVNGDQAADFEIVWNFAGSNLVANDFIL